MLFNNSRKISLFTWSGIIKSSLVDFRQCRTVFSTPVFLKKTPDPGIYLKEKEWQLEFHQIKPDSKMRIADIKPTKFKIIEGKKYAWCACGFSHTQPFCDNSHRIPQYKITLRPVIFVAPETKEVWFCNCKKTNNRPFCDGTHRKKEVQDAFSTQPVTHGGN